MQELQGEPETEPTRLRATARVEIPAEWSNRAVLSFEWEGQRVLIPTPRHSDVDIAAALPVVGLWLLGYNGNLLSDDTGKGRIYAYAVEPAGGEGDLPRQGWYLIEHPNFD